MFAGVPGRCRCVRVQHPQSGADRHRGRFECAVKMLELFLYGLVGVAHATVKVGAPMDWGAAQTHGYPLPSRCCTFPGAPAAVWATVTSAGNNAQLWFAASSRFCLNWLVFLHHVECKALACYTL